MSICAYIQSFLFLSGDACVFGAFKGISMVTLLKFDVTFVWKVLFVIGKRCLYGLSFTAW